MARTPEQTTAWVAQTIGKMGDVQDVKVVDAHSIRVTRNKFDPFEAGIVSVSRVTPEIILPVIEANPSIEIIVNVPKESMWTGDAIAVAEIKGVAFGGIRDLMSAVSDEVVSQYTRSEYSFVERGLRQHTRVSDLERAADRVYIVYRHGLAPLRFVMLNEYELTGDHIRTARDRYGAFDEILLNNPNGKPTTGAREVAEGMGVGISWSSK